MPMPAEVYRQTREADPQAPRLVINGRSARRQSNEVRANTGKIFGDLKLFELITMLRLSRYATAKSAVVYGLQGGRVSASACSAGPPWGDGGPTPPRRLAPSGSAIAKSEASVVPSGSRGSPDWHVGDHAPRHFRMRGPNLIAYASCRFTDNLYPVKHRALQQFVGVEARPVVLILSIAAKTSARRSRSSLTRRRPLPGPGPG